MTDARSRPEPPVSSAATRSDVFGRYEGTVTLTVSIKAPNEAAAEKTLDAAVAILCKTKFPGGLLGITYADIGEDIDCMEAPNGR